MSIRISTEQNRYSVWFDTQKKMGALSVGNNQFVLDESSELQSFVAALFPIASRLVNKISEPVQETFYDSLVNRRDSSGHIAFRNAPKSDEERILFAKAYNIAKKIRSKLTIARVGWMPFTINPAIMFDTVDCLAKDGSGSLWVMNVIDGARPESPIGNTACRIMAHLKDASSNFLAVHLSSIAYLIMKSGLIPANTIHTGVWNLSDESFCPLPFCEVEAKEVFAEMTQRIAAMTETLKYLCAECSTREECRKAFGKYYLDKSRNGRGCNYHFSYNNKPEGERK